MIAVLSANSAEMDSRNSGSETAGTMGSGHELVRIGGAPASVVIGHLLLCR